jgi:hypothetical protein
MHIFGEKAQIVGVAAEFEKDIIKGRVIAGLANAQGKRKQWAVPQRKSQIRLFPRMRILGSYSPKNGAVSIAELGQRGLTYLKEEPYSIRFTQKGNLGEFAVSNY